MKKLLNRIKQAELVKVFSLNAISTSIHMCTGLISTKVVATIIGPSGVAMLGQLNNINLMLQGLAAGGIRSGVTKYIAEYKEKEDKLLVSKYISNALLISAIFTTIISLVCIFGCNTLSKTILFTEEYSYVFVILGFTIFLFTLNSLLISILNGFKEFKKYVVVSISSSFVSLIFSVSLCLIWELKGAMISAVTFQSIVFFVTLYQCRKCEWFNIKNFLAERDKDIIIKYLQYTLMTLVSLSILPVSQMILRGYVINNISQVEAGWWEGMNRISNVYLSIITTSLSIYILPRMSEIKDKWELKCELIKYYKFIIPVLILIITAIYLLRHFVIWVLYTPDFYPMEKLFIWQLLGDLFKITSWILAYLMLAKAKTKAFISTEIIFGLSMLGLSYYLVQIYGTVGLNIGYMINYILYVLAMIYVFRDIVFAKNNYGK